MQENKIITVIGGTGFLGRYVVRELANAGFRIRIICRDPLSAQALRVAGNTGQIALSYGDLTKYESVTSQLAGSYAVVNLVGALYEKGRQKFTTLHAHGAERIAQAAKLARVAALVHMSALGVDRATGSEYARTKLLGEQRVRAAFPDATILRPSVVFGPEDNFFNQFAAMATFSPLRPSSWSGMLPLIGGGHTKFQPVYVGDVAAAVRAAIMNPAARGKVYELGGPTVMNFRDILRYVLTTIGRKRHLASIPFPIASALGAVAELLPRPAITRDQVQLLKTNNVVTLGALTLRDLDIEPHAIELFVPDYLARYRKVQRHA